MEWPAWKTYTQTEYNIGIDLKKMEYEMYYMHLAQDRGQGHAVVNTVLNPKCPSPSLSFSLPLPPELVTSFHNATFSSLRKL